MFNVNNFDDTKIIVPINYDVIILNDRITFIFYRYNLIKCMSYT